jgi:hypothetical protein
VAEDNRRHQVRSLELEEAFDDCIRSYYAFNTRFALVNTDSSLSEDEEKAGLRIQYRDTLLFDVNATTKVLQRYPVGNVVVDKKNCRSNFVMPEQHSNEGVDEKIEGDPLNRKMAATPRKDGKDSKKKETSWNSRPHTRRAFSAAAAQRKDDKDRKKETSENKPWTRIWERESRRKEEVEEENVRKCRRTSG